MTDLTNLTIKQALDGLDGKDFTAVELTEAHISAMEAAKSLNCFITETPDQALEQAKASDARRASGDAGLLDGIPLGIKDLFCTKGVKTTAASKILENFVPTYESTVTQNLLDDGAVFLGKLSHDEFGMGCSNTSTPYGAVINPWKREGDDTPLVPGGSSGASAAAVAARIAMGATGTDTGGSCRQPGALCGVVGIRPTYGRCSRWGIVAFASSLDQAGLLVRSVEDGALMLKSMAGFDPKDSTSVDKDVPDYFAGLTGDIKGLKIGIPKEYRIDGLSDDVSKLWDQGAEWLKEQGAEIVDISLPHTKVALAAYYIINPAEASSNLARYDGVRYGLRVEGEDLIDTYEKTRAEGFSPEVIRRILMGTYALSAGYYDAYYNKARKVRKLVYQDFENAYKDIDLVLTPTSPSPAFGLDENQDDPIQMYLQDVFTVTVNMAGLPGVSVPAGLDSQGLPLGLQLIGQPFGEETMLRTAQVLEKAANFTAVPQQINGKAA